MAELLGWDDCIEVEEISIEDEDLLDGSELERIAHRAEKPEREDEVFLFINTRSR